MSVNPLSLEERAALLAPNPPLGLFAGCLPRYEDTVRMAERDEAKALEEVGILREIAENYRLRVDALRTAMMTSYYRTDDDVLRAALAADDAAREGL